MAGPPHPARTLPPGIRAKTCENILKGIALWRAGRSRTLFASARGVAAQVVDAVHRPATFGRWRGTATLATPIMLSRVTMAASSSSVQSSVPAGRSGSTR